MKKYLIRFNKSRGHPGRGSVDHVWRVFEEDKEYIVKHFKLENLECHDETTGNGMGADDWNICCYGYMTLDKETSTAIIKSYPN